MFCKYCGKQLDDDARFCPSCGKAQIEVSEQPTDAAMGQNAGAAQEAVADILDDIPNKLEKLNPLCVAGLVLTILAFFIDYYCVVKLLAFILSFNGLRQIRKNKQKGVALAISCMAVTGILGLINIARIIEYARYESAAYGALDGVLQWIGGF